LSFVLHLTSPARPSITDRSCFWPLGPCASFFKAHTQTAWTALSTQLSFCLQFIKYLQLVQAAGYSESLKSTEPLNQFIQTLLHHRSQMTTLWKSCHSEIQGQCQMSLSFTLNMSMAPLGLPHPNRNRWQTCEKHLVTEPVATWNQRECPSANQLLIIAVLRHGAVTCSLWKKTVICFLIKTSLSKDW